MSASDPRTTFERALARRAREANAEETQRALELASGAKSAVGGRRSPRVALGGIVLLLTVVIAVRVIFFAGGPRGSEPIGAVATAEGAGVGNSVAGLLPESGAEPVAGPSPATTPTPVPSPSLAPTPRSTPRPRVTAARPAPVTRTTASATPRVEASPSPTPAATPTPSPTPTPKPPPAVINIGSRIVATLEAPVRTGATLTPATALVTSDVTVGERVVLPSGSRLVGSAFATTSDDRVQVVWRAAVVNGRTYRLDGEALSPDGSQGLPGKVVRKKKGKGVLRRIGATVLGTAGETLGYGIPGGEGVTGLAEDALAGRAGRELQRAAQDREWLQVDKVIELRAGAPLVVYVSADVVITGEPR